MYYFTPIVVLILLVLHETGHVIAAKALKLTIEKVGFSWKPIPRLFVSIIDNNIPTKKRVLYLLGGTAMTLFLFLIFFVVKNSEQNVYYAFAYQLVVETNPFYSDFVVAIISYKYKKEFRAEFFKSRYSKQPVSEVTIDAYKEDYLFSLTWYVHFILWSALIIALVSPHGLIHLILK